MATKYTKAYYEGQEAYEGGEDQNPYGEMTPEAYEWQKGYDEGKASDDPTVDEYEDMDTEEPIRRTHKTKADDADADEGDADEASQEPRN
jgi:hypothetical protein